jgi:adenosylcobinamide-phosphate guanylyltransferase
MLALIMAGGEGSRLNLGEKPLILVNGKPMIAYIVDAFRSAGCEPVVSASPRTPMTINWCTTHGIAFYKSEGRGYIDDMIEAVEELDENHPLFVCVSDIPGITADTIRGIRETYFSCGEDALSVWVPARLVRSCRGGMPYREQIHGVEACPAGINILRGDRIALVQNETALLLDEPGLALNVNTRADLAAAEMFLAERALKNPDGNCSDLNTIRPNL